MTKISKAKIPLELSNQLGSLPHSPGVYLFKDKQDNLLYVGKAKDLVRRVSSYFVKPGALAPAKQLMVQSISTIDHILVKTEQEALLLEANLIHKHQPPFNIVLKDDRSFLYIQLIYDPPQIRATRFPKHSIKEGKIFGPYASGEVVYQTLRALKSALVGTRYLPGLFLVPRRGQLLPSLEKFQQTEFTAQEQMEAKNIVLETERFLRGKTRAVVIKLQKQLTSAAGKRQYERAALVRDQLTAIQQLLEKQEVITNSAASWDVVSLFREGSRSAVNVFKVRGGKLIDRVVSALEHGSDVSNEQILQGFIVQYYQITDDWPDETVVDRQLDEKFLSNQLVGQSLKLVLTQRGQKFQLIKKGEKNAEQYLRASALRHEPKWDGLAALRQLGLVLGLNKSLRRIELIDISHLQGTDTVGSLVVATNGLPDSSQYRRFKIYLAKGNDDYASIREVVERRAKHPEWPQPDLLVIDGGAGQLNAAQQALKNIPQWDKVSLAAIAKREELIYVNPHQSPLRLPRRSAALQLVQRLRDEAHRFAITYHRKLRGRKIPGAKQK